MRYLWSLMLLSSLLSCKNSEEKKVAAPTENPIESTKDSLIYPEETHFKSLRQVTFGGDNAEAYWSFDDQKLIFQLQQNFTKVD